MPRMRVKRLIINSFSIEHNDEWRREKKFARIFSDLFFLVAIFIQFNEIFLSRDVWNDAKWKKERKKLRCIILSQLNNGKYILFLFNLNKLKIKRHFPWNRFNCFKKNCWLTCTIITFFFPFIYSFPQMIGRLWMVMPKLMYQIDESRECFAAKQNNHKHSLAKRAT